MMSHKSQRICSGRDDNRALIKRGALLFHFAPNDLKTLYHRGEQRRGGIRIYRDQRYESLLTIKVMLRLPWRAAVGFATGLLQKAFPRQSILVPDYAHASRAAGRLKLKIQTAVPLSSLDSMELAFNRAGVNVYRTSGWHQRRYGHQSLYRRRDQWKKIHLVLELKTRQILSMAYTPSSVNDCEVVQELCDPIQGAVHSVRADGAYNPQEFYQIIHQWGAQALIPPACTSKAQDELKNPARLKNDLAPIL